LLRELIEVDRPLRIDDGAFRNDLFQPWLDFVIDAHQCPLPAGKSIDGGGERSRLGECVAHGFRIDSEMLGKETVANGNDGVSYLGPAIGFDGNVTFRIEPHGPVVQVGRADT
jgi:hypothetical protein